MPGRLLAAALAAAALLPAVASAKVDYAVIGDTPYGPEKLARFPQDIQRINADPTVRRVIHLGDIKNGSSRCDTSYFEQIRADFDGFADPFVYTPGDNEWTDCHRANNGAYQPAGREIDGPPVLTPGPPRLDEVRRIFFDRPGRTLGRRRARVDYQSRAFPENVRWTAARTVFATANVPGSNDDLLPWFGAAETPALAREQEHEYATRNAADLRWLDGTFRVAQRRHARAVVIGIQADMWDPAITGDPTQFSGFTGFVRHLARDARRFGRPVLLLNGDSHRYEADRPLADPSATDSTIYGITTPVPNLERITVDGSDAANDYLRLTIDPRDPAVFSWTRVPLVP